MPDQTRPDEFRLEHLQTPPLIEVSAGVLFETIPAFDPISMGAFADSLGADYPTRQYHPAIQGPMGNPQTAQFVVGSAPKMRLWFISQDSSFVVQLQDDRIILNWRAAGSTYPRFSAAGGLLERFLDVYNRFLEFCANKFHHEPRALRVELGKVDFFRAGSHFANKSDLGVMIPSLRPFIGLTENPTPGVIVRIADRIGNASYNLKIVPFVGLIDFLGSQMVEGVHMETAVAIGTSTPSSDIEATFRKANGTSNYVFDSLIDKAQRTARFQGTKANV